MDEIPDHPAQVPGSDSPNHWPKGVRPVSLEGLSYLGVGSDGELHWDGKPIAVRKTLDLKPYQIVYAVLTLLVASVGASAAAVSAYVDWSSPTKDLPN